MANEDLFTKYFGPNANLVRLTNNVNAPFVVESAVQQPLQYGDESSWLAHTPQENTSKYWIFNPKNNTFDAYNNMFGQTTGPSFLNNRSLGQSVSAADLGLTNDPAFNIAALASSLGKNKDTWSDYAYHDPTISHEGLHENLRKDIGAISDYDKDPGAFNTFMEKAIPIAVATMATAGLGQGAGLWDLSSLGSAGVGAGEASGLVDAGVGGFGNAADAYAAQIAGDAGSLMPELGAGGAGVETGLGGSGYFGGIGGSGAGGYSLPGIGAASGSSAIPEIGIGGAAGSSATPALFSTSELASTFPGAYGASNLGSGLSNLTSAGKTASTVSDVIKVIGGSAAPIGALAGAHTAKGPQTVSGSSSRPAWMNQGLPTITAPRYTSQKIQGDPLRYGMGPQQKLYTNEQSEVYTPQNFGTSGGLPYGVPIVRPLIEEPMAYAGGSNTFDESGGRTRVVGKAHGGKISGKLGGLAQSCGYVQGGSSGQADDVPARLSPGEYVMDADIVSALGDGNNDAGAKALDKFRENIRKHKRSVSAKSIPPKAKPIEQYLKGVK